MNIEVTDLLTRVELPATFADSWLEHNPSRNLPYHGTQHGLEVAYAAQKLGKELGFSMRALQHLTVAGLLHDYNHTGVKEVEDKVNIKRALDFVKDQQETLLAQNLNVKEINNLIKATLHPKVKNPGVITACVIADADLLFWVDPETTIPQMEQKMSALTEEYDSPITVESTHHLMKETKFYTTPAWNMRRKSIWNKDLKTVTEMFQNGQ